METPLRILLLLDNRYQALLLKRLLSHSFSEAVISHFEKGEQAFDELIRNKYDFAIIGDSVGLEVLSQNLERINQRRPELAIILLMDQQRPHRSLQTLRSGISAIVDYHEANPEAVSDLIKNLLSSKERVFQTSGLEQILKKRDNSDIIDLTINTLAHEINNPLMTILGELELLLNNGYELTPEIRKKLRIIETSAHRIRSGLTNLSELAEPSVRQTPTGDLFKIG